MLHPVSSSTLPLPVPASSPAKSSSSSSSPARLSSSFPSALTPPRQLPTLLLAKEHPLLVQDYTTHRSDQPSPLSHIRSDCKASSERPLAISLNLERPSLLSLHPTAFTFETPFSGLSFSQRPTLLSGHHKLCRSPAQSEDRSSRNGNRDRIEKGNDFGNNRIDHENTGGYNTSEATLNHDADEDTTAPHPALQTTTTTTSSMSATHIDQCPLLPSLLVAGVTKRPVPQCRSLSNMDVQCTRPKPKPSPIATRLHVGTKVAAKGDKDGHTTLASACENTLSGAMNNLLMCGERSTDACDQDSGIALEPWDDPCSQLDIVQEHGIQKKHCEQAENVRAFELPGGEGERRQRCQSMVYPLTAAGTEDEGPVPRLDAGVTSQPGPKTRRKRGESMSFGYGDHGHFRPLSPPLSLETLTGSETKTSFFSSPSLHNDTTDATHSSPQSESTFRTCSRTSSPPPPSVSRFTRGIPFSEMLDLATAKAENITGLYYAKQMNRKSAPQLLMRDSKSGVHIPSTDLHPPQAGHCEHLRLSREGSEVGTEVSCKSYSQSQRGSRAGAHNGRQDITPSITQSSSTLTSTGSSDPLGLSSTSSDTQDNSGSSACSSKPQPASPCSQHRRSHSASHFFHLSSLKHHSPAQFNLALCYEHGKGGVNKDLEKAIHFYQQAADQGHTKASYNMGCICYNHGELSKAIAWFERAGKCSVRGLGKEAADQLQTEWNRTQLSSKLPAPRQSTPIHELESMLLGDLATTSGPFAAYLPAILCLALLCRQGVLTKDRETILRKDQSQAMELLHNLLQNASQRPRGNMEQDCPRQHSPASSSNDTGEDNMPGLARSNNRDPSKLPGHLHSSILYSSCPSLPLRNEMPGVSPSSPSPQPPLSSTKSSATTEGEMRDDIHGIHGNTHEWSLEHDGADDHEIWSIILARQLLNAWKPEDTKAQLPGTEIPAELERRNKTILRHHLLYITNPTLGKNLYNLGVLYDLYLGEAEMAIRCYRSAYHNSLDGSQLNSQQHPSQSTRINSAWNLGVLHVRRKEWKLAQRWFLHAQHDIVLLERQQQCGQQDITIHGSSRIHPDDVSLQKSQDGLPKLHRRSMVNVIPECKASLPSDSPGKRHARKHGLMMHLDAIASMSHRAESSPNIGVAQARRESRIVERTPDLADDGIRTDATKISWVLRWVEFQMNVS